jgi:glucuronate isomerase
MHYAVKRIFKDLYDMEITDEKSVYECNEKIKASFADAGWAKKVAIKGNIEYAIVNREEHKDFIGLDGVCLWVPRIDGRLSTAAARRIFDVVPEKRAEEAEKVKTELLDYLAEYRYKGVKAFMTTLKTLGKKTWQHSGTNFEDIDDCYIYLLHSVCTFAEENGINLQLFLGMENGWSSQAVPVNNTERILNLHGLFEQYTCNFDLVVASDVNNMDVVQAANVFRNVYAGGLWWFNFRPSTFLDSMAKRFEALASTKAYLSISDSRNIEWCNGKNALIKKLTGDFLTQKTAEGFINYTEALEIAEDWLYVTPRNLYC